MSDKTIRINLYLLRNIEPKKEELTKCVVAASTEQGARELANQESGREGYIWNDAQLAAAKLIGVAADGVDGVILFTRERDCEPVKEGTDHGAFASLYLLERNDVPQPDDWSKCVVVGSSEAKARELANRDSGAEGYVWSDGSLVSATVLGTAVERSCGGVVCFARERDS
jgi:hypothetical protein